MSFAALSNDLADAVVALEASVVRVEGRKRLPATGIVFANDVIVTAHHVLRRDENITVGRGDETRAATLIGRDPTTDLAALRVEGGDLVPATWADAADLRVGQLALALGRPGRSIQATLGVLQVLGDAWRTPAGGIVERYVQSDITMYPGFSGGPLVGGTGAILGLSTSGVLHHVSIALPGPTVQRVVASLLAHGHVRRGYLGVGSQPVRLPEKLAAELGQETGLLIVSVEPESPADAAGLVLGDTIVSVNDQRVRHTDELPALLSGDLIGQAVTVKIVRGGVVQTVEVVVGERPTP